MPKLPDKDDPNQVKEDQAPYGAAAVESVDADESINDDPSPAAVHGRVVRLETNAHHNANKGDIARVEGQIATVNADLNGKIDEAKAELKGEIKSAKAESKAGNARLEGKVDTVNAELSGKIDEAKAEAKADNAEVKGKIDEVKGEIAEAKAESKAGIAEVKAESKAGIAEVKGEVKAENAELKAENAWNRKLLYTILAFLVVEFVEDNQTIASIINFIANFFR